MDNRIWRQHDYFHPSDGTRMDMDPHDVELPEGKVPLVWQYSWIGKDLLGHVENIRRERGEIVGDLNIFDKDREAQLEVFKDDLRLAGYYTEVQKTPDERNITHAKLVAVSVCYTHEIPNDES